MVWNRISECSHQNHKSSNTLWTVYILNDPLSKKLKQEPEKFGDAVASFFRGTGMVQAHAFEIVTCWLEYCSDFCI